MTHEKTVQVPAEAAGKRLDRFLTEDLALFPRSQRETRHCQITMKGRVQKPGMKLKGGEELRITWEDLPEASYEGEDIPLDIIFEDDKVVVVNKARGMVVHPAQGNHSGTLVQGLLHHCRGLKEAFPDQPLRPGIVHRLDKETTGVLIAAKTPEYLEELSQQFRKKTTRKIYWAVVKNCPPAPEGEVENFLTRDPGNRKRFMVHGSLGKRSHSRYRILRKKGNYTLLELSPLTGRTHQLRVHMASLGCPILGDPVYGGKDRKLPAAPLMLHALSLEIRLPGEGEPHTFRAEVPADFLAILRGLGLGSF